jgi:hypothetical protein
MAKLPDFIDKNDKKAIADYFIKQRQLKEWKDYITDLIEREGKNHTFIIGQPREEYLQYLRDNGYTVDYVSHITWQVSRNKV